MKVLVITATIGQGHNAVARSVAEGFRAKKIRCEILDMYGYISPGLKAIVSQSYLLSINSVSHARSIGARYYESMEKNYKPEGEYSFSRFANWSIAREIKKYLDDYQPDAIICTQVYCAHVVNLLKEKRWTDALTVGIITDFTVQAHWEGTWRFDYIVTASKELNDQLIPKGITENKIVPTGIPINPKFKKRVGKYQARELLCLHPEKKTLLIMGGSMGYGNLDKGLMKIDQLPLDFQGIVVCGNNKRMKTRLRQLNLKKRFDIYGYSSNVSLMMDAADVIITKPGGISLSESLAKQLPIIMNCPIPGMEDYNAAFMEKYGLAILVTKKRPVPFVVQELLENDALREQMRRNMEPFSHPDSTADLCNFVIQQVEQRSAATQEEK